MVCTLALGGVLLGNAPGSAQADEHHELGISGTRFLLDGKPFPYTGISFFNAIYNPTFNRNSEERVRWLRKFKSYGLNVLRVWAQWDNRRGFVDAAPEHTLYFPDGRLRTENIATLKAILADCDREGMVVELTLFSHESLQNNIRLGPAESDRAVTTLAKELSPFRNLTFQVWNEHSERVLELVRALRAADAKRLLTNSPGFAGDLGDAAQNEALDYLTPHTPRQGSGRHWQLAPQQIASLLKQYRKPVVDDEPARNGTPMFGGPKEATSPFDQIVQIYQVWQAGGYVTYHHDMFQTGYGTPAVPPSGIPDPEFSPYHRKVLEFIALRDRYMPPTAPGSR
jgi:hypothetical protein